MQKLANMHKMKNDYKPLILHTAVGLLILTFIALHFYFDDDDYHVPFILRLGSGVLIFYTNYQLLVPRILLRRKALLYFVSVGLLLMANIELYYFLEGIGWVEHIHHEYDEDDFEGEDKLVGYVLYSIFVILGTTIRTYHQWNRNEVDKQIIEGQKNAAELDALKKQINPHFLFNSLNTICALAVKKSENTANATIMLSDLLRYVIYEANEDLVLLQEEVAFLGNYVNLQMLRLANKESVKFEVKGHIGSQSLPPLLLVSFVENAFKHGVDSQGNTKVSIELIVADHSLTFTCENHVQKQKSDATAGIGLQNTKERLKLLYPDDHILEIREKEGMFKVLLILKLN